MVYQLRSMHMVMKLTPHDTSLAFWGCISLNLLASCKQGATGRAHLHDRVVTTGVQPVMQQVGCTVGQQSITLHLTEPDASTKLAAFDGLTR